VTDLPPPEELLLHGHRVSYRVAGEGPVVVLVHGVTSSCETWREVMPLLAESHTVVAPDLLGHGDSAKPRGDYSLGAHASGIRDLLVAIGHERATFVGHSLGGGIAMQLSYQFPELCERLALVSSGGLGQEVHLALRAASLPGSEWVLPIIAGPKVRDGGAAAGRLLKRVGVDLSSDVAELARGYGSLADREAREAFVHTLRAVIDPRGQRISARDRLYLASEMPTLIVWGAHDRIIPSHHGRSGQAEMPGSPV
jgi:pimeloyl-ACP methyl ester carboxylesterase